MANPRIIIIENAVDVTGSVISAIRSSAYLAGRYSFIFILPEGSKARGTLQTAGFEVVQLPMRELSRKPSSLFFYLPALWMNAIRLRRIVRQYQPALIVNNDFYNLLPVALSMVMHPPKYVCYVRFLPSKFPVILVKIWTTLQLQYAAKIIAVSQAVKQSLPNADKVVIIGNELPSHELPFQEPSGNEILYMANFISGKGHQFAIKSFSKIAGKYPGWKMRFIGGDMGLEKNKAYKRALMDQCTKSGIADCVLWDEFQSNPIHSYLSSTFLLNFSESESFSLTTLEAQYCGRAVIATRCGGPEEIIVDGETGILVPLNDVDAMANAIEYLIMHPEIRSQMGISGYRHVRQKFSNQNTIERLADTYSSVIESES